MRLSKATQFFLMAALAAGIALGGWGIPTLADYLAGRQKLEAEIERTLVVEEIPLRRPELPFVASIHADGYVELAERMVPLSPAEPGVVREVHVRPDEKVQAEQLLLSLDDGKVRGRHKSAAAKLAATEARLKTVRIREAELAERYERVRKLVAINAATRVELDEFSYQLRLCRAEVEELKAQRRLHRAQLEEVETELARYEMRAPGPGRIWSVPAQPGMYMHPGGGQAAGVILAPDSQRTVRVLVPEDEAHRLAAGGDLRAVAFQPGERGQRFELAYMRTEPEVLVMEREHGAPQRMVQLIFRFLDGEVPLVVGQRVDVYLEARVISARATPRPARAS